MIRLVYSNRTEALRDALSETLEAVRTDPLLPDHVVVPNRNMERHLELSLTAHVGVSANMRFHRLERFVGRWIARALDRRLLTRAGLERLVLRALLDEAWLSDPVVRPLAHYALPAAQLGEEGAPWEAVDVRRAQLAQRLATLFEGYSFSRPELLDRWSRPANAASDDPVERWQSALWRRILETRGSALSLPEALSRIARRGTRPGRLPDHVHVFGLSYVARVFLWAFAELGRATNLHLYVLNPCMEFWEDVPSASELRHQKSVRARLPLRADRADLDGEVHPAVAPHIDDPAPLTWWGRPGREHVHLCNELTGADFDARFVSPLEETEARGSVEPTLLSRVQDDILHRRARPETATAQADGSIEAFACPSVRREVEIVAESIWAEVRADDTLRFHDVAVFVHPDARATYLPHIGAVFAEAQSLPHNVVDLPLATESTVAQGAIALIELLLSRFRRPDVLSFLSQPALRIPGLGRDGDVRGRWTDCIDRLGIFHGLDQSDHEGTYLEHDLLSWDQGVRRLTLGAFMTGERADDERAFELDGERYLPLDADEDDLTPTLALLLRSLANDARYARDRRLPLSDWSKFFVAMFRAYLCADDSRGERELDRCLEVARRLDPYVSDPRDAAVDTREPELPVGVRVATELLRGALDALGGSRGEYLADGVVVSALAPMRSIPFRHVYLLGMGEGRFPTRERRDPLDLRSRKRRVGDVTPSERDKYVFLETLLSARDRFVASWVARDSTTGDGIEPSPVVRQLLDLLALYVEDDRPLVRTFPLRRHEDVRPDGALTEALGEASAREAGAVWRAALGRDVQVADLQRHAGPALAAHLRLARVGPGFESVPMPSHTALDPTAPGRTGRSGTADETVVRDVSLASLRRFLESPLQGWARSVLRLDDVPDVRVRGLEDEPFRPDPLDAATGLRESFERALRERRQPRECYADAVWPLQAHGRWPLGVLAEQRTDHDVAMLGGWARLYRQSVSRSASMPPRRVRFGPSPRAEEADEVRSAIELTIDGRTVRIVGHTHTLVDQGRASLVLMPREAEPGVALKRERLRRGLGPLLDYVALVASESAPRDGHRGLIFFGGESAQDASCRFGPLHPEEARGFLTSLTRDLLNGPHAYFLPCEAVFMRPDGGADLLTALTPADLSRAIERVRRARETEPFERGPVRTEHLYPAPEEGVALDMVRRRLSAYIRWSHP